MAINSDQKMSEVLKRLSLVERRLQYLYTRLDIAQVGDAAPGGEEGGWGFPPEAPEAGEVTEDVRALIRDGRTIEAIKLHREQTGLGLAEAKAEIEQLASTGTA
jgi:ribosomal protein L7/L12